MRVDLHAANVAIAQENAAIHKRKLTETFGIRHTAYDTALSSNMCKMAISNTTIIMSALHLHSANSAIDRWLTDELTVI